MKKQILLCALILVLVLILAGCGCDHQWEKATCDTPRTCSLCGKTQGVALGHTWQEATCEAPKTCSVCQATEGGLGDHIWQEATCEAPKTCSVCQATEGELGDHIWQEATCTKPKTCSVCRTTEGEPSEHTFRDATCLDPKICSVCKAREGEPAGHKWVEATLEAPKTCSVCKVTEGSKLELDPRFNQESAKPLLGVWICDTTIFSEMIGVEDYGSVDCRVTLSFSNTGHMTMNIRLKDESGYVANNRTYAINRIYSKLGEEGLTRDEADEAMLMFYGYNVPDYVDSMLAPYNTQKVYYVEGSTVHSAPSWQSAFESNTFSISGSQLVINGIAPGGDGQALVWTRG